MMSRHKRAVVHPGAGRRRRPREEPEEERPNQEGAQHTAGEQRQADERDVKCVASQRCEAREHGSDQQD